VTPWWLELYVFVLIAASVAWAAEVLWLAVGRRIWRRVARSTRRRRITDEVVNRR
jgi:hypothetical protein